MRTVLETHTEALIKLCTSIASIARKKSMAFLLELAQ